MAGLYAEMNGPARTDVRDRGLRIGAKLSGSVDIL